nr:hypothetical protein [Candidatus Enterousia merdequi]
MEHFIQAKSIVGKKSVDMSKYTEYMQNAWQDSRKRAFEAWQATKGLILR